MFRFVWTQSFKATAKGKGRLANSAAGDIWLHCLAVIVLAATMAIGIWQLVAGAQASTNAVSFLTEKDFVFDL